MKPTPKQVADARKVLREDRKARRKPSLHVNAKETRGRVLDKLYLAHLRRQPCCVGPLLKDGCDGPTDPAHIRFSDFKVGRVNPGKSRKSDDRWALPVCRKHHEAQHRYGNERRWWEIEVQADPSALAADMYAQFQAGERK